MSDMSVTSDIFDCNGLFDSHAHYFDKRYDKETKGADKILVNEVFGHGIEGVINVGTNNNTSRLCIKQAAKYPKMYAAVGIHPEDIAYCNNTPEAEVSNLYELVGDPEARKESKIVAIGEIGLDYHYPGFDKKMQMKYFEYQLSMAEKLDLPVVIHDRDAHGDCFETILRHPNVRGVFHSFSGSAEMAKELVRRGWYISFSGVLTFKNARKTVEVAETVPLERILIETDAPYLAPHPHRGSINHSGLMRYTADRLAQIKSLDLPHLTTILRDNTKTLFGV